ncbi:YrhB domain-containing protein [Streptomyces sp. NPDC020096]
MLVASVAVPKNGHPPFLLATDDPWSDLAAYDRDGEPRPLVQQARRINARGCVLAVHAGLGGAHATALPWKPADEAPGWWDRLLRRYFPQVEAAPCANWDEVIRAVRQPGPDTRGVVWVRRELRGVEATGHLLYVHQHMGQAVILDGQSGGLGRLETDHVKQLILARFPGADSAAMPWDEADSYRAAEDLSSAIRKAESWLRKAYGPDVSLVDPSPADELTRGWLFACNTVEFLKSGNWTKAMLDAAIVVPKGRGEPFGLPNSNPWAWLATWDSGVEPGTQSLELPPAPGAAAWLASTMPQLGEVLSVSEHFDWPSLLAAFVAMPAQARAIVWVRRKDRRNRETVGLLLHAAHTPNGVVFIDGARNAPATLEIEGVITRHLIRYR